MDRGLLKQDLLWRWSRPSFHVIVTVCSAARVTQFQGLRQHCLCFALLCSSYIEETKHEGVPTVAWRERLRKTVKRHSQYVRYPCQYLKHVPPIQWVPERLSLGVKRPRREADHSPPSNAEVKNAWRYTTTPAIRLHDPGTTLPLALSSKYKSFRFSNISIDRVPQLYPAPSESLSHRDSVVRAASILMGCTTTCFGENMQMLL
jgi:hypothetical protein